MPTGSDSIVPEPPPAGTMVRSCCTSVTNPVTIVAADSVTWQGAVPEQPPPDQPSNVESALATAVSGTTVSGAWSCEHVRGQVMLPALDVTPPLPEPVDITMRSLLAANAAITLVSSVT